MAGSHVGQSVIVRHIFDVLFGLVGGKLSHSSVVTLNPINQHVAIEVPLYHESFMI